MDDTTITETIGPDSNSNLQDLVNYIDYWTTSNNMKLNVGKCKSEGGGAVYCLKKAEYIEL